MTYIAAIHTHDVRAAWASAMKLLLESSPRYSLVLNIDDPCNIPERDLLFLDPRHFDGAAKRLLDVATTIFPRRRPNVTLNADEFLRAKARSYQRWRDRGAWGTYFERLVSFGDSHTNQLLRSIEALNGWARRQHAALVLHLSSPEFDKPRAQGQPCWHYGEFLREGNESLSLLAVYRSHDYFLKALGNLVGLGRLLDFVSTSTGLNRGRLICVSSYATLGCSKAIARAILERID